MYEYEADPLKVYGVKSLHFFSAVGRRILSFHRKLEQAQERRVFPSFFRHWSTRTIIPQVEVVFLLGT
jgi:hypothetical protein